MATTLEQFRKIIFTVLGREGTANIQDFYDKALSQLQFDEHDLAFVKVKKVVTKDQNWRRNLRNALQGLKDRGELVNSSPGIWALPLKTSKNGLDPENAWNLIIKNANDALADNLKWESTKQGHLYNIVSIEENKIVIHRESKDTLVHLNKGDVIRGITFINAAGGTISRRTLNYTVAKEVAIVFLHPNLEWTEDFDSIKIKSLSNKNFERIFRKFEEASNDDINDFQSYARRVRKGQAKLRKNLLAAYQMKCCISKTGPENVLQAAHIDSHSETGCNISTNAILLRSDLHDLFDDGLLMIEPTTLLVRIHPLLKETDYFQFNGRSLSPRVDLLEPDRECLKRRWVNCGWTTT